jgi:hypothetical protein
MVTDARNADEVAGRDPRFSRKPDGQWQISVLGEGPVTTGGSASSTPIRIGIEDRPLADVYLQGGSFELMVDGDNWQFYSDTPGVRFTLYKTPQGVGVPVLASRGGRRPLSVPPTSTPGAGRRVTLRQIAPDGSVKPLPATLQQNRVAAVFPANAAYVLAK